MKKTYSILAAVALAAPVMAPTEALAVDNATVTAGTAAVACGGGTATKYNQYGGPGTPNTVTENFVKVGFSVQCSSNTHVAFYDQSPTAFWVGAGSTKGNQRFRGSSNGGAVVTDGACATTTGCVAADATTAASNASSM